MVNPRLVNLAERLGSEVLSRQEAPEPKLDPVVPPRVSSAKDYIVLENIVCRDADGKAFEHYPKLFVRKEIERDGHQQINHNPYDWIPYFEDMGLFLPSFALSCNILAALYNKRSDPEINRVLMQYKDHGPGYGWHAQNTVVDWGANRIIHYPAKDNQGGRINTGKPTIDLCLKKKGIKDMSLKKAMKNKDFKKYIQNLTGLTTPEVLVEIGKYFGKPAYVWTSSSDEKREAWLGCCDDDFNLYTDNDLDIIDAARGVRAEK